MSKYKDSFKQSLKAEAKSTRESLADFFDASSGNKKRLKSNEVNGTFNTKTDVKKALKLLKDNTQPPAIRAAAAMGLTGETGKDEDLLNYLIETLANSEAPVELREACLTVLQTSSFTSPIFLSKRAAYQNALRGIVAEETAGENAKAFAMFKQRVIEFLALDKDEYVQKRLVEGLEDPKTQLVKPEVAIQLLAYDLHSDYYPILRKIAKNPPNKRSKKEAIRNLGADPGSTSLLIKTLKDKNEDKETRHVSAVGLQSLDPEALQKNAKPLLIDPKEDNSLQVALLNTVTFTPDTKLIDDDKNFQKKLESFQESSTSRKFKKVYKNYQRSLKGESFE